MRVNIEVKVMDWLWIVHCGVCYSKMSATKGNGYWCKKCDAHVPSDEVERVAKELVGRGYSRSKNVEL